MSYAFSPAAGGDVPFYVRQFARTRFRGWAHLENDFRRFAAAYRIAPEERRAVRRELDRLYRGAGDGAAP